MIESASDLQVQTRAFKEKVVNFLNEMITEMNLVESLALPRQQNYIR